ncbi:hypothetical protein ACXYMU_08630 [Pontibacter sp. CAU 1760]
MVTDAVNNFEIHYDSTEEVLVVKWKGDVDSTDVRAGYRLLLQEVYTYKPRKMLLDFQHRHRIRRNDQQWVFGSVFPEMLRLVGDTVFMAIVLPITMYYGLVADMNGDELMQDNNFLIIQHTLYQQEAFRWLRNMQPVSCLA